MLGIGFFEIVLIAIVGLIAIGPQQLPFFMRKLAGFYRQFLILKEEFSFHLLSADEQHKEGNTDAEPGPKTNGEANHNNPNKKF